MTSERQPEWMDIETAPKDGTTVLVVRDGYQVFMGRWWGGREWSLAGDTWGGWANRMTHWMPVPQPPKGLESNEDG